MRLTDAVVLVTGASAGIGHAAAVRFATRGARVLVHNGDPERTQKVAGEALVADLASPPDRQRLAADALDAFGRVDVLVNNAGFGYSGPVSAMPVDVIRRLIDVDLLAAIELTRSLLPGMVERNHGAICFVTSIAGRTVSLVKPSTRRPKRVSTRSPKACGPRPPNPVSGSTLSFPASSTRDSSRLAAVPVPARGHDRCLPTRSPTPWSWPWSATARKWAARWLRIAATVRALAPGAYRRLAVRFGGSA